MNFTLSLPEEIGAQAKEFERGVLSRLLRDAVTGELERRKAVAQTLYDRKVHEIYVEDDDGRGYTGRITGTEIAFDDLGEVEVFLTDDERVIAYDGKKSRYWVLDDPVTELRDWLPDALYVEAMHALGEKPVIDL